MPKITCLNAQGIRYIVLLLLLVHNNELINKIVPLTQIETALQHKYLFSLVKLYHYGYDTVSVTISFVC